VVAVRDRLAEFANTQVAVVTFADPGLLDAYRRHLDLPFPVVSDPTRAAYQALGLERGSARAVWNLGTMRLYARLLREGGRVRRPTEDTRQLGGDFVIDAEGRLVAAFRPPSPDTRPSVEQLIRAALGA
jgi:peroxiredoxin